jgi:hypothetical protein
VTSVILLHPLLAFSGGVNHEVLGAEDFLMGVAPPPGIIVKVYLEWYTANKLKDDHGRTLSLARDGMKLDKANVFGIAPRLIYVSPIKFKVANMTGFLSGHTVWPFVKRTVHLDVLTARGPADTDQSHSGLRDVSFGPGITWHHKSGLFHCITGLDIFAPTGEWNPKRLVNVGSNVWSIVPVLAFTVFAPFHPNLDLSMKMDYSFNTTNDDFIISATTARKIGNLRLTGLKTHLRPGQEFHFDYSVGYALWKPGPGMQLRGAAAGYFYQQTTDDKTGVGSVKDDKGRVFAAGPALFFDYKTWLFQGHVYFETEARNRAEGINSQLTILYKF